MVGLVLNQKCVNVQNHLVELLVQAVCKFTPFHKAMLLYTIALQSYAAILTVRVVGHVQLVQLV